MAPKLLPHAEVVALGLIPVGWPGLPDPPHSVQPGQGAQQPHVGVVIMEVERSLCHTPLARVDVGGEFRQSEAAHAGGKVEEMGGVGAHVTR